MAPLCWRHHTLIQALLSRGPLSKEEFCSIFTKVTGKSPGAHQHLLDDYLLKMNEELSYVQFALRACRNQYDGGVYYGIVNVVADEQSKLGTKYTPPQIAFYKGIIEAIVQDTSAQGCISNISALNLRLENQVPAGASSQSQGGSNLVPAAFRNFSMSQKERTLEELVRDQWLCSTPDGKIGLGIRSFLDLQTWFRINEVPACEVCNEAAVKADLCQNEGCNIRIHQYCVKQKFAQTKVERVCPGCGTQWQYSADLVALKDEDTPNDRQPPEPPSRKRPRSCRGDGAGSIGSSSQSSILTRVTRSSARLRGAS